MRKDEKESTDKWLNAAWEIAVAVVGGVLVATISAVVVAHILHRHPRERGVPMRSDSAFFDSQRTVSRVECDAEVDE